MSISTSFLIDNFGHETQIIINVCLISLKNIWGFNHILNVLKGKTLHPESNNALLLMYYALHNQK